MPSIAETYYDKRWAGDNKVRRMHFVFRQHREAILNYGEVVGYKEVGLLKQCPRKVGVEDSHPHTHGACLAGGNHVLYHGVARLRRRYFDTVAQHTAYSLQVQRKLRPVSPLRSLTLTA